MTSGVKNMELKRDAESGELQRLVDQGMTIEQLGERYQASRSTVQRWFARAGVQRDGMYYKYGLCQWKDEDRVQHSPARNLAMSANW